MNFDYESIKTWVLANQTLVITAVVAFVLGAWIF